VYLDLSYLVLEISFVLLLLTLYIQTIILLISFVHFADNIHLFWNFWRFVIFKFHNIRFYYLISIIIVT